MALPFPVTDPPLIEDCPLCGAQLEPLGPLDTHLDLYCAYCGWKLADDPRRVEYVMRAMQIGNPREWRAMCEAMR